MACSVPVVAVWLRESGELMLHLVPRENVPEVWPKVADWIKSVADSTMGRMEPVDIARELVEDRMALWLEAEGKGCVLTRFDRHPKKLSLVIAAVVGSDMTWTPEGFDQLCEWGREAGCDKVEALARPGWERVMKGKLKKTHVFLEGDL